MHVRDAEEAYSADSNGVIANAYLEIVLTFRILSDVNHIIL